MLKKLKKIRLSFNDGKAVLGSLLIISGIGLGLYIGIWLMFIGGIIQIINTIKSTNIIPINLAIGIAKVIFCSVGGWISAIIPMTVGMALVKD